MNKEEYLLEKNWIKLRNNIWRKERPNQRYTDDLNGLSTEEAFNIQINKDIEVYNLFLETIRNRNVEELNNIYKNIKFKSE